MRPSRRRCPTWTQSVASLRPAWSSRHASQAPDSSLTPRTYGCFPSCATGCSGSPGASTTLWCAWERVQRRRRLVCSPPPPPPLDSCAAVPGTGQRLPWSAHCNPHPPVRRFPAPPTTTDHRLHPGPAPGVPGGALDFHLARPVVGRRPLLRLRRPGHRRLLPPVRSFSQLGMAASPRVLQRMPQGMRRSRIRAARAGIGRAGCLGRPASEPSSTD